MEQAEIMVPDSNVRELLNEHVELWCLSRLEWLQLLHQRQGMIEIRASGVKYDDVGPVDMTGLYEPSKIEQLMKDVELLDLCADSVRVRLNPVRREAADGKINELELGRQERTEADIAEQRWFFIDVDSPRPLDRSATEKERMAAWAVTDNIVLELRDRGWPEPIVADSGNGFGVLFPVDLPSGYSYYPQRALQAITRMVDTSQARIDQSKYKATQFIPLFGTGARVGESTCKRPHRQTTIRSYPRDMVWRASDLEFATLTRELMDEVGLRD